MLAVTGAVTTFVVAPAALADPTSASYDQGRKSIADAVSKGPLHVNNPDRYCETLLGWDLRIGNITGVDSPPDFISGCADAVREHMASQ